MEKYSVLISIYKKVKPEEFQVSLESMINQTVSPDQIIIVFDGAVSTELDNLVEEFHSGNNELFTLIKLDENKGLANALNVGLKYSRNDLIARMDSDDYSCPIRCEKQLKEFEKRKTLSLLGTNTQHFIDSPSNPIDEYGINPNGIVAIKSTIRRNSAFSHPTVMFRKKDVIEAGLYDPKLRRSQDHDLFSRMIALGYEVDNIMEPLVLFRSDEKMVLRNRNKESCRARRIIQKRLLQRKQCSVIDYLYVVCGMFLVSILPEKIYIRLYAIIKNKK